eukprot:TRINITY_DN5626_c0_g2_i2.p1 TRINITY_DN5626_c0_g2~~TRINITY_DN5626_c0_g2_i2.p1  ORF type:complete len:490 (-),score=90.51 TRINITY_DN5626_c0_g2_i2:70-1539(-)
MDNDWTAPFKSCCCIILSNRKSVKMLFLTNFSSSYQNRLFVTSNSRHVDETERQEAIKQAFLHTWNGYVTYAWGYDELQPVAKAGVNGWGAFGITILDSIDTMMIMGLKEEVAMARGWVEKLNFKKNQDVNVFESTIRMLGGLLSAYDLSMDSLYLSKARELADLLLHAFNTNSGIPYSTVNLQTGYGWSPKWVDGHSFLSEFGSIQLEFRYLSHVTNDTKYATYVNKINDLLAKTNVAHFDGLYPTLFHPHTGLPRGSHLTYGSRGDSFYEILLKQYLQSSKTDKQSFEIYLRAVEGTKKRLLKYTPDGLAYIDEMENNLLKNKVDHLTCFSGGMLALDGIPQHLEIAKKIIYTCWQFYERNPTGLAPEIAEMSENHPGFKNRAAHYLLRPETVESLFVLYRQTGDKMYQDWGWSIFRALEMYCKTEAGFSGILNVGSVRTTQDNKLQSFFLAETLKYLFLLFSPTTFIPLDEYVFNTEAHPTRIFGK